MTPLSQKQIAMLESFALTGDHLEPTEYYSSGELWWVNRERTINSLIKRGLINANREVTEAGMAVLKASDPERFDNPIKNGR